VARHFHYVPELIAAFSWCLLANPAKNGILTCYYGLLLMAILVGRAKRDAKKCTRKYGPAYKKYAKMVPWFMIPGVYWVAWTKSSDNRLQFCYSTSVRMHLSENLLELLCADVFEWIAAPTMIKFFSDVYWTRCFLKLDFILCDYLTENQIYHIMRSVLWFDAISHEERQPCFMRWVQTLTLPGRRWIWYPRPPTMDSAQNFKKSSGIHFCMVSGAIIIQKTARLEHLLARGGKSIIFPHLVILILKSQIEFYDVGRRMNRRWKIRC